ncbi:uncharacterized protein C8R40DRAFT_688118 [Lentinula edodes]|uniref:uncharacterized protein n=1 Tax=Lentinula edodes TaxID=5353 RepID=UPI001E8DD56D|nr:uncharacterized protein C8R40DRAFT_688118 [Lentinula edodes]KAH7878922.1 hypothetical protein C8R40DRAFT_688118 [Lentinula edodes]
MTITKLGAISCDTWYKIIASLAVLGRAAVIVTFTLRTYVVWAQSRIVLISLVMLGLATVLTDAMYVPRQTCENTRGDTATFDLVRSFLTISFETLSATLILIRSLQAFRRGSYFNQYKLIHFLMQEGAVYFCIVSLFTIATFVLKLSTESKYLHDLLNAFTLPLSGLLTARFLLHLRAWNKARSSATTAIDIDPGQNEPDPDWPASSISSFGIQSVSVTASLNSELTSAWITTAEYGEDPMLKVPVPT